MSEILVQALWKIDRKTFVGDEFKLVALEHNHTFSPHEVRSHTLKSATKQRVLYDLRFFTPDKQYQIYGFTWRESAGIWDSLQQNSVMSEN
jgi:hypothetical protein